MMNRFFSLARIGIVIAILAAGISSLQAIPVLAGGGGTSCGQYCTCSGFDTTVGTCRGYDTCSGLNGGQAIQGTAYNGGNCGPQRGWSSHDYFCQPPGGIQCTGGGGGGGGCPPGQHKELEGPECRESLAGGYHEADGCDPKCGYTPKGAHQVCAEKQRCVADPTPPPWTPPPGWSPPPGWTPPATPVPSDQPLILEFRITNFTKRPDASSGIPFYFILAPQMQAGYKANIRWTVTGAASCSASCIYKDNNGTRLPDGSGQANDCQWWGDVNPSSGNKGVQPKWQGTVEYTLNCVNGARAASETFYAAVREFSWQEVWNTTLRRLASIISIVGIR